MLSTPTSLRLFTSVNHTLMPTIPQTLIRFPDIRLGTRDAHKLRGYFGELFKQRSPLLHNHFEDGSLRYKYPLVQYKVVNEVPTLVGLNDGASLLTELFLKITELKIGHQIYPVMQKNLDHCHVPAQIDTALHAYKFANLWMALNQENHSQYVKTADQQQRLALLNTILRNNILSFFKGVNVWIDSTIMVKGEFSEHQTQFKGKPMAAFAGEFVTNAVLPDLIGIGKSVSRGFGTVIKK